MSWAGNSRLRLGGVDRLDVYIGTRAVAICRGTEKVLAQVVENVEESLAAAQAWLADSADKQALHVWLSGGLSRPFLLQPVPGVKGTVEMQRIADSTASQHTGLTGVCRVWTDRAGPDEARFCIAVLASTLDRIHATLAAADHRVVSIRPWWAEVLRSAVQQQPAVQAVATQDCDSLTVLTGSERRFEMAKTLTPVVDRDSADAALTRMLMSADIGTDQRVLARLAMQRSGVVSDFSDMALAAVCEVSR